jgi:hypothetical protein
MSSGTVQESPKPFPILSLGRHRSVSVADSRATVVDRKGAPASWKDPAGWRFHLKAERSASHIEATKDCSIGPFAKTNHDRGPDNLDLPTKKLRAIVEPQWLNPTLKPSGRALQAKDRVREKRDIAANRGTRISD